MKIGIIGAGPVGYRLAEILVKLNHEVLLTASAYNEKLQKKADAIGAKAVDLKGAVTGVELVIVSIPFKAIPLIGKTLFDGVPDSVIVVDTSNYYPYKDGQIDGLDNEKPESIWVSEHLGRPVIKAFNDVLATSLDEVSKPKGDVDRVAISVSGDSVQAKEVVRNLIDEIGFDTVDAGTLSESWRLQPGSPAYCTEFSAKEIPDALNRTDRAKAVQLRDALSAQHGAGVDMTHEQIITILRDVTK